MKKIRINELARELEVKAHEILDRLPELGVTEKKTHSSSIDEDVAIRLRRLYGQTVPDYVPEEETAPAPEQAEATPAPVSVVPDSATAAPPATPPVAETTTVAIERPEEEAPPRAAAPIRPPLA